MDDISVDSSQSGSSIDFRSTRPAPAACSITLTANSQASTWRVRITVRGQMMGTKQKARTVVCVCVCVLLRKKHNKSLASSTLTFCSWSDVARAVHCAHGASLQRTARAFYMSAIDQRSTTRDSHRSFSLVRCLCRNIPFCAVRTSVSQIQLQDVNCWSLKNAAHIAIDAV